MAKELGRIGQRRYSGIFTEEFLPELRGARGAQVFTEMADNDSTIGAILFAIENLMRNCEFTVEPGGNSAKDKEAAEFVQGCMEDMSSTWTDTLSEILSFITYGWSYHEIVYKRRMGKTGNPQTNSKYDDGLIGWAKLPIRSQETLHEWKYKEHTDDLTGMEQWTITDCDVDQVVIPITKALHFITRSRKQNPEGRSILRTAYRDWYFKKRIQEIEGIGIERDLAGFPTITGPEGLDLWDTEDPDMVEALATAEAIVTGIRRDSREGLVLPNGWELNLLSTGSRRQFDTNVIIERYNKSIATSVLTDFVLLGHESVGSFALADNKTKMFALAVGTYLDIICEVFNSQAIPKLIDINGDHFKGITDYPQMKHGDIEDANLEKIGNFLQQMVGIGALTPDDELEDYVRQIGNLPERKTSIPIEERKGEVNPEQEQDQNQGDGQGENPDGEQNGKKGKAATMYEIKSIMADYLRGTTSKQMATNMLQYIGIPDKDINAYLADYDQLRADNERKEAAKKQAKTSRNSPKTVESEESRKEKKAERDIDDIQDEKEAEEAKKSLGRGEDMPTFNEILKGQQQPRKSRTFSEILKFNPYHDRLGRFASRGGGGVVSAGGGTGGVAGRKYGTTDAKDAAAQLKDPNRYTIGGKKNSLDGFLDENGKLTPEREALHKKIIDDMLKDKVPVDGQPKMTMLGGGPAAGKSSVMSTKNLDKHTVKVDPDDFKKMLPGYSELSKENNMAADFYHEESSALAKRFSEVAYSEHYNVVYDGTGDGSNNSVAKKINAARAQGYRIEGKYVSIDTEEAVKRNQARYDDAVAKGENPRLVPADYVRSCHSKVTDISVAMAKEFDYIEVWDNNGAKGEQKLIATGGGGKGLTPIDKPAFDKYLSKGAKGLDGFMTLPTGEVIPITE